MEEVMNINKTQGRGYKYPLVFCDHCDGEIYSGDVYYCPDTGDVIHTDCLTTWARGLVRRCNIEELYRNL